MQEKGKILPVMLRVEGRLCVVVGGGQVALRKAKTLIAAGARVRVVSPQVVKELRDLAATGALEWKKRKYQQGDLEGALLAVAAANDPEVNRQVAEEARAQSTLVNIADDPEGGDYQVPSFFTEGPLTIAVSTTGQSPALAAVLRRMIQQYLGASLTPALSLVTNFRSRVKEELSEAKTRVRFWEKALTTRSLELARQGKLDQLAQQLEATLRDFQAQEKRKQGRKRKTRTTAKTKPAHSPK